MNLRKKYPQGCPRGGEDEHPNRMDSTILDQGNGQTNTSKQCTCGKICKNERGLKIHQGKMKCLVGTGPTQRTGSQPGETQEEPGPESPHSARNLQVLQMTPSSIKSERRRIKWPAANMTSLWNQFDIDVDQILEATMRGDVDRKMQAMTTILVSIAAERFGEEVKEGGSKGSHLKNQREERIHNIRQEMKTLKQQYKQAGEEERTGLAQLMCILRKKIRILAGQSGTGGAAVKEPRSELHSVLTPLSSLRNC